MLDMTSHFTTWILPSIMPHQTASILSGDNLSVLPSPKRSSTRQISWLDTIELHTIRFVELWCLGVDLEDRCAIRGAYWAGEDTSSRSIRGLPVIRSYRLSGSIADGHVIEITWVGSGWNVDGVCLRVCYVACGSDVDLLTTWYFDPHTAHPTSQNSPGNWRTIRVHISWTIGCWSIGSEVEAEA